VPPAVRHYLLTGEDDPSLDGHWDVFALLYAPLGSTREEAEAGIAPRRPNRTGRRCAPKD